MSQGLIPTDASPSSESRFPPAPPSLQAQGSAPFGFYGVPLAFQPTPQGTGARQSQDMPKRRVSEARRQRTPMSCDRCKVRKIKCINPTPGPCGYCTRMKFHCQITAQRKHRPLYFTSDEQFQWMIAILQHFVPDINLELDGLKALGAQLGVAGPALPPSAQAPMRNLPPTLERAYGQGLESSSNPSENIAGSTQSPVSDFLGEEELDISEDHGPTPNDDSFNPPTRTMALYNKYDVPVNIGSPGYSFNFPERALADIYVQRYFNEINNVNWVLSYYEFMSWYRYDDPSSPLNSTRHVILSLVFAFGANDVSISETYYSNALNLIGSIIKEGGLQSVQALMLMSLYSMHETRGYSTWALTGLAIRIAQCMNLMQDNDARERKGQDIRRRVWWTLYDMERLFSSNLSLTSSIIDECVNTSLPADHLSPAGWLEAQQKYGDEMVRSPPPEYTEYSISLSQILGRTATYLSQSTISLFTLLHYFNELQEWSDTLPEHFRRRSPYSRYHAFLSLRWRHAVMVATKPFLSSLALLGLFSLPVNLRGFFEFCASIAASAARESLDIIKSRKQGEVKGITAFYRLFLLQSSAVFALSAVIRQGSNSDGASYKECLELLTQIPGGVDEQIMGDMHMVENKLEQFAAIRGTKPTDTSGTFYSPMSSLSFKQLAYRFNLPNIPDKNEENLARWISRKVTWEDISECITAELKREGPIK